MPVNDPAIVFFVRRSRVNDKIVAVDRNECSSEVLVMWRGIINDASGTPEGALQGKMVNSAAACAELCRQFGPECQSFTWRPDRGNSCWLKNDWTRTNERRGDAHAWSGVRCTAQEQ